MKHTPSPIGALTNPCVSPRSPEGASAPQSLNLCPQCDVPMLRRITDEDTGCSYPCDEGEGYCASCDSVWSDQEPTWEEFAAPFKRLADGFVRIEL